MCYIPGATELALASAVIGATSATMSYMGQQQAANDANAAFQENAANSVIAYQQDIEANNLDFMARQEDTAMSVMQTQREGLVARAAATADSTERGVGGLSAAAIRRALGFQAGENAAYIRRNEELNNQRARLTGLATRDAAQSRINSAPRQRGPSLLSLGLNLANSAVSGYSMYSGLKADEAAAAAAIKKGT